jgi:hypothetical protein
MTTPPPDSPPEPGDDPGSGRFGESHPPRSYPPPGPSRPGPDEPAGFRSHPAGATPPGDLPAWSTVEDPLVPADLAGWTQRVAGVVRRSFTPLALLTVITTAISALGGVLTAWMLPPLPDEGGPAALFGVGAVPLTPLPPGTAGGILAISGRFGLAGMVASAVVTSAGFFVAVQHAAGRPVTARDGLRFATGRWLPFLGWAIVGGVVVTVPLLVLGLLAAVIGGITGNLAAAGFVGLLGLIPTIYLAVTIFSSLYGCVVVERTGLSRCFQLIKGRWAQTCGRLLLAALAGSAYYGLAAAVAGLGGGPSSPVRAILLAVLTIPLGVVATAVLVVTYAELRSHEHAAVGTPRLAAELDAGRVQ